MCRLPMAYPTNHVRTVQHKNTQGEAASSRTHMSWCPPPSRKQPSTASEGAPLPAWTMSKSAYGHRWWHRLGSCRQKHAQLLIMASNSSYVAAAQLTPDCCYTPTPHASASAHLLGTGDDPDESSGQQDNTDGCVKSSGFLELAVC